MCGLGLCNCVERGQGGGPRGAPLQQNDEVKNRANMYVNSKSVANAPGKPSSHSSMFVFGISFTHSVGLSELN